MKRSLIKKSLACILSLSFCAILASCTKKTDNGSTNSTNIYTNKDIQAYAKRNANTNLTYPEVVLHDVLNNGEISIGYKNNYYALITDSANGKYSMYLKNLGATIDIPTDESERVSNISPIGFINNYGYILIYFNTGKKMVIDTFGNTVIEKMEASSISLDVTDRIINDYSSRTVGDVLFYDFFFVTTTEGQELYIFDTTIELKKGLITKTVKNREKLADDDDIDYSRGGVNSKALKVTPVKDYNVYYGDDSVIVRDLDNKVISTLSFDDEDLEETFALDDRVFFQTEKAVTINDDYTYSDGTNYYLLKSYTFDLKTGTKTEIKDYKYLLTGFDYVPGYSEKQDRDYAAGVYATLRPITDKRLEPVTISATLDSKGNILSSRIGEKGELAYIGDEKYVLYDEGATIIDSKGKVIISSMNYISIAGKTMFVKQSGYSTEGYFVDFDLKAIEDVTSTYYVIGRYKNENMMVLRDGEVYLMNTKDGKVNIIGEKYDGYYQTASKISGLKEGTKYALITNALINRNIYLVEYVEGEDYVVEVYSYDGTLLKKYEKVTNLSESNSSTCYFLTITTEDGTYYIETSTTLN
ncbi:MAG: hypothetical protein J6Y28_05095 [Acholeplasmatales bacterium]|nr:hypothetical protein [Acholeplasmatales bacterium]